MRNLTKDEVEFTVSLEYEDLQVRGNCMCSNDLDYNKQCEDELIDRLNNGDIQAWCCLTVKAEWEDFKESVYLGGCSFESGLMGSELQKAIEEMAEEHGMYDDALNDLNAEIRLAIERSKSIEARLTSK